LFGLQFAGFDQSLAAAGAIVAFLAEEEDDRGDIVFFDAAEELGRSHF
jgi:hypothetical protein